MNIINRYWQSRLIICPRCEKEGILTQKTTISKGKYKYKKWYVYHNEHPFPRKPKFRKQRWCYLNKNQLENPLIHNKITEITNLKKQIDNLSYEEYMKLISPNATIVSCPECGKKFVFEPFEELPKKIICQKRKGHAFIYENARWEIRHARAFP